MKKNKYLVMLKKTSVSFEKNSIKWTFFLFFGLIVFSSAVFVFAENDSTTQDIFNDADQDGLSNEEEKLYGTDPMNKDTDGDGYSDGVEVESGYDPLKPAPGDRIVEEEKKVTEAPVQQTNETSLTKEVSNEIVELVKTSNEEGKDVSLEDVNASVNNILSGKTEEIVLPEIKKEDIKIKKISKKLSDKKKLEQEKKDALEYLTVVSYLLANNSPKTFQTQDGLGSLLNALSMDSLLGIASGNTKALDDLAKRGEKILTEIRDVEVPEDLLNIHMKIIQMAQYAIQLKGEVQPNSDDPLGQIAVFSKAQGLLGNISDIVTEVQSKLTEYGIEEIPLNL